MYSFNQYSKDSDFFKIVAKEKPRRKIVKILRYPFVLLVVSFFQWLTNHKVSTTDAAEEYKERIIQKYNTDGTPTYQYKEKK